MVWLAGAQDNTVEILEILESNSGKDPFPSFLKRGPLPKVPFGHVQQAAFQQTCRLAQLGNNRPPWPEHMWEQLCHIMHANLIPGAFPPAQPSRCPVWGRRAAGRLLT